MKCPYIVKLMQGEKVSLEDVQCPDQNQKCWSCKVGPKHPNNVRGRPQLPRQSPFYEEQA